MLLGKGKLSEISYYLPNYVILELAAHLHSLPLCLSLSLPTLFFYHARFKDNILAEDLKWNHCLQKIKMLNIYVL